MLSKSLSRELKIHFFEGSSVGEPYVYIIANNELLGDNCKGKSISFISVNNNSIGAVKGHNMK